MHVPRNHGIVGHAKIILDLMKISVANSTADYLDVNIFWASVSAKKKKKFDFGETQMRLVDHICQKLENERIKSWF